MSSSSTPSPRSLDPHHLRYLMTILRRANFHYSIVASNFRSTYCPTHHARNLALRRGLKLNILKAVQLDQRHVSVVPLPILDTETSPPARNSTAGRRFAMGPLNMQGQLLFTVDRNPSPLKRRPALKCAIPRVLTRTTPGGSTSAITLLSSTSDFSVVSLSSPVPVITGTNIANSTSAWFEDESYLTVHAGASTDAQVNRSEIPVKREWQHLDVPIDEEEMDWGLDNISEMAVSPLTSPRSVSSGSDATSSSQSAGPATPVDETPIVIRIKRKSTEILDYDFEKRPRFEPKDWVHATDQLHRNVIRIPARR